MGEGADGVDGMVVKPELTRMSDDLIEKQITVLELVKVLKADGTMGSVSKLVAMAGDYMAMAQRMLDAAMTAMERTEEAGGEEPPPYDFKLGKYKM